MRFKLNVIILLSFFFTSTLVAQIDSLGSKHENGIRFFGYFDVFCNYDLNKPIDKKQLYSSNPYRVNQFGLDYSYIQAAYVKNKVEANLAFNFGGIVDVMYEHEPIQYKFIREASFKYYFSDKVSIESGIMPA